MRAIKLLLIEDDESALFGYERYLAKTGYMTTSATTLKEAKNIVLIERFDAILLDLKLPDGDSIEWIPELKTAHPNTPVIVITGTSDIPTAVTAIKNGAENFLTKPIEMENLKLALEKCIELGELRRRTSIQQRLTKNDLPYIGNSAAINECLEYAKVAAANSTVVLLLGETGTGKGVLARWIHNQSEREHEPFVELNCSSLRGELLRSELFGHARGSFTSAIKDKEGLIEVADGGTLFLDEIGDMDIEVQAQLLKTIEEKSFRRVGENQVRRSDFRLLCATNRDLLKETETVSGKTSITGYAFFRSSSRPSGKGPRTYRGSANTSSPASAIRTCRSLRKCSACLRTMPGRATSASSGTCLNGRSCLRRASRFCPVISPG